MWKSFSWKENEKKRIESEYFEYEEERSKKKPDILIVLWT